MFSPPLRITQRLDQQQTLRSGCKKVENYFHTREKITWSSFSTVGSGPGGNRQNVARMFVRLKDWDQRQRCRLLLLPSLNVQPKRSAKSGSARFASSPPAISGTGSSTGFDMELQDHAGAGMTR